MAENMLFLPGLLCDARLWHDQIASLSDVARSIVADLTRDDRVEAMARRALDSMPERFALCGLSMGGYVAMALMRLAPERVTRLCLMDTSARPDTPEKARQRRTLMAMTQAGRFRGVTPRLLPMLVHRDRLQDAALTAEVMGMAERVGKDAFLRQQTAILHRPDSRPYLPEITVPTLVMVGSDDQLTPPDHAEEMVRLIPHARLHVVAGAAHLPPLERPEAVGTRLREWLDPGWR
jgi:pimeloyl-ACP methyl ester carboxylesterase